jgi:peptide/nickel transport system permease protein
VFTGDFGQSMLTKRNIVDDITRFFPATMELATVAILIGTSIGIPVGVWSAVRQGKLVDQVVRVLGLVGYSAPIFWLGLLGLLVFYANLQWVGGPGRIDIGYEYSITQKTGFLLIDSAMQGEWAAFRNVFGHIILPASLLGYYSMAYISRMTRSFMLNELAQEYITTARVKGVPEWRIIWIHALRNAAVPLVTVVALSYANLLEGSVLTETVFAWPGLGQYLTNSLQNADMNAVLGCTVVIGTVFIGLNLFSDLLYSVLDPRVRRRA